MLTTNVKTFAWFVALTILSLQIAFSAVTPKSKGDAIAGDWRAAVWGAISIFIAMFIYYPFAKAAQRQRLAAEVQARVAHQETTNVAI